MFKYVFEGVIFEAETLEKLQQMLVAAGFKGNVIEEFQKAANKQDQDMETLNEFNQDPLDTFGDLEDDELEELSDIENHVEENGPHYIVDDEERPLN